MERIRCIVLLNAEITNYFYEITDPDGKVLGYKSQYDTKMISYGQLLSLPSKENNVYYFDTSQNVVDIERVSISCTDGLYSISYDYDNGADEKLTQTLVEDLEFPDTRMELLS